MKTETIIIGGVLLTAAAIRTILLALVPLVALLLTLAGWRPAPSAAAAPAPAVELPRPLALAPEPALAPIVFPTPTEALEVLTVSLLRRLARERGIGREVYHFARKPDLIRAILAATPDRGGTGRASG